ncbi:multidrug and toxin extrusion 1 [Brachionus plicatilis]|uniref:Multidrug and toxin extrusion protein n=1 Tax=Brachionus plicatilis TaxID=10195 RepID=A0A3M7Q9M7_BRAPC|nr:multidrug and toxin extrusion 1 [Brachionus plicatilis]
MTESGEKNQSLDKFLSKIYPLGFKDEAILIFKNSIPLSLSILSQQLLTMMSFFFCGHVGPNELAGVSLANTLIHICSFGPIVGLTSSCETLFPQLFGGSDKKKVGIILQKGVLISLLASLLCIGLLLNAKYIMNFFVDDQIVLKLADTFLIYFSPSILFYSVQMVLTRYLQAQNIFYPVLFINILVNILNACMQGILVIWANYGVIGSAVSILIANIVQLAILIFYILKTKIYVDTWPGWSVECLYNWKLYLKLGIAGLGMVLFEWACFEIAVMSSGLLGKMELSVMSIAQQTAITFILFAFGIATSGNIRIGQLLGENSPDKSLNSAKVVYTITGLCAFCLGLIMLSFSNYIPAIFTNNQDLIKPVSKVLKFLALVHFFDAVQVCGGGILRALGAQVYGVIIAIVAYYLVGLPVGLYLLLKTPIKVTGFWVGILFSSLILFVFQAVYIYRVNWVEQAKIASDRSKKMNEINQIEQENFVGTETLPDGSGVRFY